MSKNNNPIWSFDNGEIINEVLGKDIDFRYKPDTPFDNSIVPYLIMIFCAGVDGFVFYSLFSKISYDSPVLLAVQIAGFLFGFDVVPIFIGIQYKRIRQRLTRDRFVLILALVVCAIAVFMNTALRIMTIDLMAPAPDIAMTVDTMTNSFGDTAQSTAGTGIDPVAIALTIFGIGIPVVTSLGSFFISFVTYNPLQIRKQRLEKMIAEAGDHVRRLDAIIADYEAERDFAEYMQGEDKTRYDAMLKMYKAKVVSYCDYVRERLKEHLADPSSNNALSKDICVEIMARLDRELASMEAPVHKEMSSDEETSSDGETSSDEQTSFDGETSSDEQTSFDGETSSDQDVNYGEVWERMREEFHYDDEAESNTKNMKSV